MIELALIAAVTTLALAYTAYRIGLKHGFRQSPSNALNEFQKAASKREYVSEFIAVGENAEIVEIDPSFKGSSVLMSSCVGCRYAGRYVLKP